MPAAIPASSRPAIVTANTEEAAVSTFTAATVAIVTSSSRRRGTPRVSAVSGIAASTEPAA